MPPVAASALSKTYKGSISAAHKQTSKRVIEETDTMVEADDKKVNVSGGNPMSQSTMGDSAMA